MRFPLPSSRYQACFLPELRQPRSSTPHLEQTVGPNADPGLFLKKNDSSSRGTRVTMTIPVMMSIGPETFEGVAAKVVVDVVQNVGPMASCPYRVGGIGR